jgi:DNA-binding response OmpR family regulator
MRTINILLFDDDVGNVKLMEQFFQPFGAEIFYTLNADDALENLQSGDLAFTLVSLKLAQANSWYFLRNIKNNLIPIIGLVEQNQSFWMKQGRAFGINAYLVKPLDYLNIKTYLPSALTQAWTCKINEDSEHERRNSYDRRNIGAGRRWYDRLDYLGHVETEEKGIINAGLFSICSKNKCVFRNGNKIKLTPTEYKLLLLLIQNRDQIVSIKEIISNIWEVNGRASEEDVKQYIYMLRKKIEENPAKPSLILNQKGFGYTFTSAVCSIN